MAALGVELDEHLNTSGARGPRRISFERSPTTVLVIPTNAELAIARACLTVIWRRMLELALYLIYCLVNPGRTYEGAVPRGTHSLEPTTAQEDSAVPRRPDMISEHGGEALAWGAPERVGWFRYFFDDERWEWSPQVAKMHGYEPGTVVPTTDLVLSHKHPDDYRQIADTLALIRQTREAFSSRHRIRDVQGSVHHVVVVGDQMRDGDGSIIGTHGFYVDITPAEQARQDHLTT